MSEQSRSDTARLYSGLLYAFGFLGAVVSVSLYLSSVTGLVTAISIGINVTLLFWAYTLHEGWHRSESASNHGL